MFNALYWLLAVIASPCTAWVIQSKPYSAANLIPRFANETTLTTISVSKSSPSATASKPKLSTQDFITIIPNKETALPSEVQVVDAKPTLQMTRPINAANAVGNTSAGSSTTPGSATMPGPVQTTSGNDMTTTCTETTTPIPSTSITVSSSTITTTILSNTTFTFVPPPSGSSSSSTILTTSTVTTSSNTLPPTDPSRTIAIVPAIPNDPDQLSLFNSSAFQMTLTLTFTPQPLSSLVITSTTTTDDPVVSTVTDLRIRPSLSTTVPLTVSPFEGPEISTSHSPAVPPSETIPTTSPPRSTQGAPGDTFPLVEPSISPENSRSSSKSTKVATTTIMASIGDPNDGSDDGDISTAYVTLIQTTTMMTKMQTTPLLTFATAKTIDTANVLSTITVSVPAVAESSPALGDPALLSIVPIMQSSENSGSDGKVTVYMTKTVALSTVTETVYSRVPRE